MTRINRNNATFNLFFSCSNLDLESAIPTLKASLLKKDQLLLKKKAHHSPKLRTYVLFAGFSEEKAFLSKPLSFTQRRLLAKLRLGILPIRIETGRYDRPKLEASKRHCFQCNTSFVEDEAHFLLYCMKHSERRANLLSKVTIPEFFTSYSTIEKLDHLLNSSDMVKHTAKYVKESFNARV